MTNYNYNNDNTGADADDKRGFMLSDSDDYLAASMGAETVPYEGSSATDFDGAAAAADDGAPAAIPSSILGDDGSFSPEWFNRFEDLREHKATLSKFRRPEALAKSYAALERMRGYPGIENEKQMPTFRRSVGLPDHAEDYHLARPEGTEDGIWDDGLAGKLSALAYQYGVPAAAMDALAAHYCEANHAHLEQMREQESARIAEAEASLEKRWGRHFEDNMHAVQSVLVRLSERSGVDLASLAENPALRGNADFAQLMLEVSKVVEEPPMRRGSEVNHRDEAYRIAHDATHPLHEAYMTTHHPQHRYANEQYDLHAARRR